MKSMKWNVEKLRIVPALTPVGAVINGEFSVTPLMVRNNIEVRVSATVSAVVTGPERAGGEILRRGQQLCMRELYRDVAELVDEAQWLLDHDPQEAHVKLAEALRIMRGGES